MNIYDNEEGQGLNKYKSEGKAKRYIPFLFIAPPLPLQRESDRPTNLDRGIRILNNLVCILKIYYLEKFLFCLRVSKQKGFKTQKKKSILAG